MKNKNTLDQHIITISPDGKSLKIIDSIGEFILGSLNDGATITTISRDISETFSLPFHAARQDVTLFIEQYFKASRTETPTPTLLKKETATILTECEWQQFITFPNFTLQIAHDEQESLYLLRPLFKHLESPISDNFIADYRLTIQRHKESSKWEVFLGKDILISGKNLNEIILPAIAHVYELAIRKEPYLILLHASGVSYGDGSIIFPAIGGSGKSTLCAALIKNNFGYISDDIIPVSYKSGQLISFPFAIGIKKGSWKILEKFYPELPKTTIFGNNALEVKYLSPSNTKIKRYHSPSYLIIPCYKKGVTASIEKTPSIEGLKAIIEGESLIKQPFDNEDIKKLVNWVKGLKCYKITYDNLDEATRLIQKIVYSTNYRPR